MRCSAHTHTQPSLPSGKGGGGGTHGRPSSFFLVENIKRQATVLSSRQSVCSGNALPTAVCTANWPPAVGGACDRPAACEARHAWAVADAEISLVFLAVFLSFFLLTAAAEASEQLAKQGLR